MDERIEKRLSADEINGIYIPANLGDCFIGLDKMFEDTAKERAKNSSRRSLRASGHFGIGMWMRNNWGLWQGSRLKVYFKERGVNDPDRMSGIILFFYFDWLNGNNDEWRKWEENPQRIDRLFYL